MSAYLETSFDSKSYQNNRPTYPLSLYNAIMSYHSADTHTLVDVGCGTGIATFPFLEYFDKAIGCDPSSKMLSSAEEKRTTLCESEQNRIEFKQVAAESLSTVIPENSVDMVVGAESIHWVKHKQFFEEAYKILRPRGTLAFWFYVEPIFLDYPEANKVFQQYVYEDKRYLGPYWPAEMQLVKNYGKSIVIPQDKFQDIESEIFVPLETKVTTAFRLIKNNYTIGDLKNLICTWSIYHTWKEDNKESSEDVADLIVKKLQDKCGWDDHIELRVEWGTSYYLMRKRGP